MYLQCQILNLSDPEVVVHPKKKPQIIEMRNVSLHQHSTLYIANQILDW